MLDDIEYGKLIYKRGDSVEVYAGRLISENKDVCIKLLYIDTLCEANEMLDEAFQMLRFKDHPNIVKILHNSISQLANGRYIVHIIMDYYREGDLKSLICNCRMNSWSDSDLLEYLKQLVSAFACLEEKQVAHRNIKPENIFVSNQGKTLIVGNLKSAREILMGASQTIAGTPLYLSPELRRGYLASLSGSKIENFKYDPYKSDVYSLGLTFLYMATLRDCSDLLDLSARVQETKKSRPRLCGFLMKMLRQNPVERISFVQLRRDISEESGESNSLNAVAICSDCFRPTNMYFISDSSEIICEECMHSLIQILWKANQQ